SATCREALPHADEQGGKLRKKSPPPYGLWRRHDELTRRGRRSTPGGRRTKGSGGEGGRAPVGEEPTTLPWEGVPRTSRRGTEAGNSSAPCRGALPHADEQGGKLRKKSPPPCGLWRRHDELTPCRRRCRSAA